MSSIHTLVALFAAEPTLTNAKKITAKTTHNPMSVCLLLTDGIAQVEKAKALVVASRQCAEQAAYAAELAHYGSVK